VVGFIVEGKLKLQRKPPTGFKSLRNFIT
jgi:hypothetical protein